MDRQEQPELDPIPGLATALALLDAAISPEAVRRTLCDELDLAPGEAMFVVATAVQARGRAARAILA